MNKEQRIVWIDQYLKGELPEEEISRFEEQYRNNLEFAKAVDFQKEVGATLADREMLALSREVEAVIEKLESRAEFGAAPPTSFWPSVKWRLWIGIGLIVFVLIFLAWPYFRQEPTAKKKDVIALIDEFMQEETGLTENLEPVSRTARPSVEGNDSLQSGGTRTDLKLLYRFSGKVPVEEHLSALNTMDSIYLLNSTAVQSRLADFFLTHGLHNLYAGRIKEALSDFEQAKPAHPERVEWYSALAFLKIPGSRPKAVAILQSITSKKHQYREQAEALLDAIPNE